MCAQVYLLKSTVHQLFAFPTPELLNVCNDVWAGEIRARKKVESVFHQDVGKILSMLQRLGVLPGKLYQNFIIQVVLVSQLENSFLCLSIMRISYLYFNSADGTIVSAEIRFWSIFG